jgi:DNA-binding MarR family transcriptional regulator
MAKATQSRKPKVIKTEAQLAAELEKTLAEKGLIAKIKNQKDILEVRLHPLKSGREASEQRLNKLTKLNEFLDTLNKEQGAVKAKVNSAVASEIPASK